MVGMSIKCIVFLIILCLPVASTAQVDGNTNVSSFNISVTVINIEGNPVSGALIQADGTVLKQTDAKGRADLEIRNNTLANLTVKAKGYRDWVSREPIGSMLMLTMQNELVNFNFHIRDTRGNGIPEASIRVEDSAGNLIEKFSNANGSASFQVYPGLTNITVKAMGYEDFRETATLSGNATYTYVLNKSWIVVWTIIALIIPFLLTLLLVGLPDWPENPENNMWYAYIPAFGWVVAFIILIYVAGSADDYNIYFLDPMLKVSLFVPIAAFLGATSYIMISVLNNIERKPTASEWKYIYVGYGRRLLMAPYIAVIALFTILEVAQTKNLWVVLFFAYFVGLYTKQIEGTLEEIGKKFLTEKQKTELLEREMKALEIVRRLGVSAGIASKLQASGISEVGDLIASTDEKLKAVAKKAEIDEAFIEGLKKKATEQAEAIETMTKDLKIDSDLLKRLVDAGIYSKDSLIKTEYKRLVELAGSAGIGVSELENLVSRAKKEQPA